jgi:endogenous inhibitor of DNA gyrase (YacG/DUF329 family)|tara:strand:+ start:561 stop:728 length:168 start_codon:yes stop_codon:yes gene_type:complete
VQCGKPTVERFRPFCSRRCADLDLGSWLNGTYRIETEEEAEIEDFPTLGGENKQF